MGSYRVELTPSAIQEFGMVPFPFRRQINQRLSGLRSNPRPRAAASIAGEKWVLPVHGWLVLYEIDDAESCVTVVAIVQEPPQG